MVRSRFITEGNSKINGFHQQSVEHAFITNQRFARKFFKAIRNADATGKSHVQDDK